MEYAGINIYIYACNKLMKIKDQGLKNTNRVSCRRVWREKNDVIVILEIFKKNLKKYIDLSL